VVFLTGYHVLKALAPPRLKAQEPLLDKGTSQYDETLPAGREQPDDES
jgi:hypothetical protein